MFVVLKELVARTASTFGVGRAPCSWIGLVVGKAVLQPKSMVVVRIKNVTSSNLDFISGLP
jgi:hypothetical protein